MLFIIKKSVFSGGVFVCSKAHSRRLNWEPDGEFCLIVGYIITLIHLIICSFANFHYNFDSMLI